MKWLHAFSAACVLSLASCDSSPDVSEAEQAYLDRTKGFVQQGSYPVAHEITGSDGYLLRFTAGENWNSKDSPQIRVKSLSGKWMPFYAGDSGQALKYCPEYFSLLPDKGQELRLYFIASPEDSIAEIVVDNHTIQAALYQRGDSIVPLSGDMQIRNSAPPKGELKADSTEKKGNGLFSKPR